MDVHGENTEGARRTIDMQIHAAKKNTYRIRVVHGYNGGTRVRSVLREGYSYGRESAVERIEMGGNQGITELVLRGL